MTSRFGVSRVAYLALVALATAGCSPDRAAAPNDRLPRPAGPAADIAKLTTAPILFDNSSSDSQGEGQTGGTSPILIGSDFVVPTGSVWTVTAVAITGEFGSGVASLPLSIRPDVNGAPGAPLPDADVSIAPTATDPNACKCWATDYLFPLPKALTLTAGRYWLVNQSDNGAERQIIFYRQHSPETGLPIATSPDNGATWDVVSYGYDYSFAVFGTTQFTQTITLASVTPNPTAVGSTVTLDATASSGLLVSLAAGPASVCTLNATTLSFVGLGTCSVTANQAGNATYLPASQVTQDIGVGKASQTITFTAIAPNPATVSTSATLGATVSSGLAVSYSSLTTSVCTVNENMVSYIRPGTCTVTADAAGNATYYPATQATQSVEVAKITQTINLASAPPAPGYVNGTYSVGATGGASGNPVGVTAGTPNVCTVNGSVVRFIGVGACTVTENQAGNDVYAAAPQLSQTIKVDYRFDGFVGVKNNGQVIAKAGQVIPLKWRLTDANGAPVTTLTTAVVMVRDLLCRSGTTGDQVAEQATGGSGLQNLGNGYYQYNWKSPSSYANSCKILALDLGEGSGPRTAHVVFTK